MKSDTPQATDICVYLGDGAYARFDGFSLLLYTSNGMNVTNEVYLEPGHVLGLLAFLRAHCGYNIEVKP